MLVLLIDDDGDDVLELPEKNRKHIKKRIFSFFNKLDFVKIYALNKPHQDQPQQLLHLLHQRLCLFLAKTKKIPFVFQYS